VAGLDAVLREVISSRFSTVVESAMTPTSSFEFDPAGPGHHQTDGFDQASTPLDSPASPHDLSS
jgi:hypothetical protein